MATLADRLSALISAIGADMKSADTRLDALEAASGGGVSFRDVWSFFTDFLNTPAGDLGVTVSGTGAASSSTATLDTNRVGILQTSTGTTATGRAAVHTGQTGLALSGGEVIYEACVRIPTLSTSTDRYALVMGLFDTATAANQVDGVYFLYDEGGVSTGSTAAGYWQTVTSSNSSRTFNTGLTQITIAANTWYKLKIVVNAAGTSVGFYVDDVLVATHTATIPTGTARVLGAGWLLIKSVGTTARTALFDFLNLKKTFTTPR